MHVDVSQSAPLAVSRSRRMTAVTLIAPLAAVGGIVWAVAQPYRLTLLDPRSHGIWDLISQPPLLVVLVAVVFELAVARPLLVDLDREP